MVTCAPSSEFRVPCRWSYRQSVTSCDLRGTQVACNHFTPRMTIMDSSLFAASPSGRVLHTRTGYDAFVPDALPPRLSWQTHTVAALSRASYAVGTIHGQARVEGPPHFEALLLRRDAVSAARIEGQRLDIAELITAEATGSPPSRGARLGLNYIRAFEHARLEELPLSLRLVRQLHSLLLDGVEDFRSTPGEFRRSQNWLGPAGCTPSNAVFVPPPVAEMRDLLHNWETSLYEPGNLPPLVRVALAHYQLTVIHPFLNMNAATGLLFAPLYLHYLEEADVPVLFIGRFLERRSAEFYQRMLDVCQRGTWDDWLSFYLHGIEDSANYTAACVRRLRRLYFQNVSEARSEAMDNDALRALDMLFQRPMVSIDGAADFLGLTSEASRRALARLEDAGVVTLDTTPCPVYVAGDIVAALEPDSSPFSVYEAFF